MRILVVDEFHEDRTRTIHLLRETLPPVDLVEAADCGACEQALAAGPFDVVLIDDVLSWTDGLTLLRQVHTQLPGVP